MTGFSKKILISSLLIVGLFSYSKYNSKHRVMELSDLIFDKEKVDAYIANNFSLLNNDYKNPLFPYKVNYKGKSPLITFGGHSVVDCWALKSDRSFTFFFLLKSDIDVFRSISEVYGQHEAETELEINDQNQSKTYHWEKENISILLKKYRNVEGLGEYKNCNLVIIGNMDYQDIITLPSGMNFHDEE